MSNFYFPSQHHNSHSNMHSSHSHHAGRSRRATRASANHHQQQHQKQQLRAMRLQKEAEDHAMERALTFRREFDAARSFDFEDDELFCPFNLMTDDDLQSMSSGSDRSSLSSGSPEHSPIAQQIQPAPAFLLPPSTFPSAFQSNISQSKIHQPLAQRTGAKAIPIVDPSTRAVASPPPSVSPGRQMLQGQQFIPRRAW